MDNFGYKNYVEGMFLFISASYLNYLFKSIGSKYDKENFVLSTENTPVLVNPDIMF